MTLTHGNQGVTLPTQLAEVALALAEVVSTSKVPYEIADVLGCNGVSSGDLYQAFIKDLPPFASIYLSGDGNIGGEPRSVIAGFYRALSQPIPSDPDHLSNLLSLLAGILNAQAESAGTQSPEKAESVNRAKLVILSDHILSWLPAYLLRANEVFPSALENWVAVTMDLLAVLSNEILNDIGQADPAVSFDIARNDVDQIVSFVTSPGRSGIIVTQSDIEEISRALDLPLRVGRKRFILEDLFAISSRDVLGEFHSLAIRQCQLFESNVSQFPSLRNWIDRASQTIGLLSSFM